MTSPLERRSALVIGGSSGIGLASAQARAAAGARVSITGVDEASVHAATASLSGRGADGTTLDVREVDAVEALLATFDGIDVLVYSAGVQRYGTVVETSPELWDEVLGINLRGAYLVARAAIPRMPRGAAIVNVASVQGIATQHGVAAYTASKAALLGLTRAMAIDHAGAGIRVNAVCPGSVDTPMLRESAALFAHDDTSPEDLMAGWGRSHPLGRVATPAEIGSVVAFLAGGDASFVTGSTVTVDGGLLAALAVDVPR